MKTTKIMKKKKNIAPQQDPILTALERALKKAEQRQRQFPHPEIAHHAPCLRKAKQAILQSKRDGNNISMGALHTLPRVGHWVIGQIRENLDEHESVDDAKHGDSERQRAFEKAERLHKEKEKEERLKVLRKQQKSLEKRNDQENNDVQVEISSDSETENDPNDSGFVWKYITARGKKVRERKDAQHRLTPTGNVFRVEILHSDGRIERAWLSEDKAPVNN